MSYYKDVLHVSLATFQAPDVREAAETGSPQEMAKLIQLMLGVAINCDKKDSECTLHTHTHTHPHTHTPHTPTPHTQHTSKLSCLSKKKSSTM